jgi:hypothetical protein
MINLVFHLLLKSFKVQAEIDVLCFSDEYELYSHYILKSHWNQA